MILFHSTETRYNKKTGLPFGSPVYINILDAF